MRTASINIAIIFTGTVIHCLFQKAGYTDIIRRNSRIKYLVFLIQKQPQLLRVEAAFRNLELTIYAKRFLRHLRHYLPE